MFSALRRRVCPSALLNFAALLQLTPRCARRADVDEFKIVPAQSVVCGLDHARHASKSPFDTRWPECALLQHVDPRIVAAIDHNICNSGDAEVPLRSLLIVAVRLTGARSGGSAMLSLTHVCHTSEQVW